MVPSSDRGSLSPLPEDHRRGLVVLTGFSILSFISTSLLWSFITYKIIACRIQSHRQCRREARDERFRMQARGAETPDLSMGLSMEAYSGGKAADLSVLDELARKRDLEIQQYEQRQEELRRTPRKMMSQVLASLSERTNPFPIIVYNLLLADMMEAMAYALSIDWVIRDGIFAPSPTCWAQGLLGSTSNLAAGLFLSAASINTFLTIVVGYRMPRWGLYSTIIGIWTFVLLVNAAGVLSTEHGTYRTDSGESYFMRANVWCWISSEYNDWRLWSHYFWIIVSLVLTVALYGVVFYVIWVKKRQLRYLPRRTSHTPDSARLESEAPRLSGYHPVFLVYPFVYLVCITPLIIGRVCLMLGTDLGIPFFAFAGSLLAGNGLFNSILWMTTIVFSAPEDMRATGFDQYSFTRTPARDYGHTVVISGPGSRGYAGTYRKNSKPQSGKEWWWWEKGGLRPWGRSFASEHGRANPDLVHVPWTPSIEGPYIQMDVVTRVVVEDIGTKKRWERPDT